MSSTASSPVSSGRVGILTFVNSTTDFVFDLAETWPREELRPRQVEIYVEELADIPLATLGATLKILRRTSEFRPTIRAIRETAAEIELALPSEDEALTQVEQRIAWGGQDEMLRGEAPTVHPDVKRALDHIGGFFAYRATSEPSIVRAQFLKSYREIRAAQIRGAQITGMNAQLASAT